jgi:hypothetical protein
MYEERLPDPMDLLQYVNTVTDPQQLLITFKTLSDTKHLSSFCEHCQIHKKCSTFYTNVPTITAVLMHKRRNLLTSTYKITKRIALGYGLKDRRFESRQGLGIFLFTTASRLALGPTKPPIQWVPEALSVGVKRPERGAIPSLPQDAFMAWCSV